MNATFRRLLLLLIAISAIVILSQFVRELQNSEEERVRSELRIRASEFTHTIRQFGDEAINNVLSIGAFFESSGVVTEREFARFVIRSRFLIDNEHLRAVGILPVLKRSELAAFNAALKAREKDRLELGYQPLTIEEDVSREIYMPVIYVESTTGRDKILGYDIATDAARFAAAQASLKSLQPHITSPIQLTQDDGRPIASVLILAAVVNGGDLGLRPYKSGQEARTSIIAASYSPEHAINRLMNTFDPEGRLSIQIADVTGETPIEIYRSGNPQTATNTLFSDKIVIGDRVWAITYSASDANKVGFGSHRVIGLGIIAAILILALALALDRVFRHQSILANEVKERTEQLNLANAQLAKSAEQANEESDAKSMFLAHMSHELRTPLNAVIGYAQMLTSEIYGPLGDKRYHEYARTIESAGNIQLQFVEDILSLTAIQGGNRALHIERINLTELAETCVGLLRTQIEGKSLKVDVLSLLADEPFYGDKRSVQQIIISLLLNAIKFTPADGEINVRLSRDDAGATLLSVSDNGIGIAPKYIDKVMQPFGQAHVNPYNAHEGVGLGLSIVTGLAEVNGGFVRIESAPEEGTTVTIHFPPERDEGLKEIASGI